MCVLEICHQCRDNFEPLTGNHCYLCGDPDQLIKCGQCEKLERQYPHVALYSYNSAMKAYFYLFKFFGGYHLKSVFELQMKRAYIDIGRPILVPIPISNDTKKSRGFNQVEALLAGIPITKLLICQEEFKPVQKNLSRQERLASKQPFHINDFCELPDKGRKICIVDDIYTTGQTIHHATQCLRNQGFVDIMSLSLAR